MTTIVKTIPNFIPALSFEGSQSYDLIKYDCGHADTIPHDDGNFTATGGFDLEGAELVDSEGNFIKCARCEGYAARLRELRERGE